MFILQERKLANRTLLSELTYSILGFSVCAAIIFFAGKRLSVLGDEIARITGLGQAWIGLILMAAVTSLPELMVGISSSYHVGSADLAVGDVLGSCAFNLGLLTLMDVFTPKQKPLLSSVSQGNILAASFGVVLVTLTGLGLYLGPNYSLIPSIGMISPAFAVIYFYSVRTIYHYERTHPTTVHNNNQNIQFKNNREIYLKFTLFSIMIIIAALFLPTFAETIAVATGLGKTFVGTLFLAITTSLPEIAVSISAIRLGMGNMAVGNILGSNIFNIFILFIDDLFYQRGILLKDASDNHIISVFFIILMSMVAILGFVFPFQKKRIAMGWDTLTISVLYVINMVILFLVSLN